MLTDSIKSKIDALWDKFWSGGIANPLTAIEQISYLLFMRRLDARDQKRKEDAEWLGLSVGPSERVVVGGDAALPAGLYHAEIVLVDAERPVEVIVSVHPIPLGEGPHTWGATPRPCSRRTSGWRAS